MKKSQLITIATTTTVLAATALYLLRRKQHQKRLTAVSNAGYEMAYDIHYPLKYKRS